VRPQMNPSPAAALAAVAEGVTLRIRLRPGASRTAVLGRSVLANGDAAILAAVSAPPEDGKANAALIQLLAKLWHLPKSRVSIVTGASARNKMLHIEGPPAGLLAQLGAWIDSLPIA